MMPATLLGDVSPELLAIDKAGPLCVDADPALFFPKKGLNAAPARELCRRCPALEVCRDYALYNEREGTWAGMTALERQRWRTANGVVLPDDLR